MKDELMTSFFCLIFFWGWGGLQDLWLDVCTKNVMAPATSIASPDCVGHLMKLGHRAKEWQRRFCLLKDACLYFYVDINVPSALGNPSIHPNSSIQ